jgi:hypothetical protein
MKPSFSSLLLVLSLVISSPAAGTSNNLPADVEQALRAPDNVILYSLEPWEQPAPSDEALHHVKVLGHAELDRKRAAIAIGEFRSAVSGWDGRIAMCFDPRQALRVTTNNCTYDLLLCYACHQLYVYQGDKRIVSLGASGSSKILNGLLSAAKVPLSATDSDEDRAANWKQAEASRARWVGAMPKSLRPLWERATRDELSPNIKPLRAAVTQEFPDNRQRILALFTWFGSGDGPWSGFPSYETVAEELLLDFPTPDLSTAAQTEDLTEQQLEGAARLFGGWDFSKRRPNDLKTLPSVLKKKLLDHSLKTTDEDKRGRAKHAFAPP